MGIEEYVRLHPLTYVHIAYVVVWVLHFGYAAWVALDWRRTTREMDTLQQKSNGTAD